MIHCVINMKTCYLGTALLFTRVKFVNNNNLNALDHKPLVGESVHSQFGSLSFLHKLGSHNVCHLLLSSAYVLR